MNQVFDHETSDAAMWRDILSVSDMAALESYLTRSVANVRQMIEIEEPDESCLFARMCFDYAREIERRKRENQ